MKPAAVRLGSLKFERRKDTWSCFPKSSPPKRANADLAAGCSHTSYALRGAVSDVQRPAVFDSDAAFANMHVVHMAASVLHF